MKLFKQIKEVFNNTNKYEKPVSDKSTIIIHNHNIDNLLPDIVIPEYDRLFSLKEYLERIEIPEQIVHEIIESNNPFGKSKKLFSDAEGIKVSQMFYFGALNTERYIKLLSLWMSDPVLITGHVFYYLVLKLGCLCDWNILQQKALNPYGLEDLLTACQNNDYDNISKYIDKEVISCFALAHIRSNKELSIIIDDSFHYLDMNTRYLGSAAGSFYNLYGKETVNTIIKKIIECAYVKNKFSLNSLFKSPPTDIYSVSTIKYDVFKMNKCRNFYIPNPEDRDSIIEDIFSLNQYINDALELIVSFPDIYIEPEDIIFNFDNINPDTAINFCVFTYNPTTPTGRISKYPLKLDFYCAKKNEQTYKLTGNSLQMVVADGIRGEIEYLMNGELGKARIIINYSGKTYIIYVIDKKGDRTITKIECIDDNNRFELYNINKKHN